MRKLTLVDFFCGAGGFSEGFKQQGFSIIRGYDKWKSAIDTYNYNFGKGKAVIKDILEFEGHYELAEKQIPDSHVIVGSPPCVSFSTSNKSGKADKAMGIRLIETFLKIVAIKKYKKNSILKAWFMENVTGSLIHIKPYYTFKDLGLDDFARLMKFSPTDKAIVTERNCRIINSAEFGSPQKRLRAILGEIVALKAFVDPVKTHSKDCYLTLGYIKSNLPAPNEPIAYKLFQDPLYSNLKISKKKLTDHFYDTGLYEGIWANSREQKINHPYMGRMSFPENEERPSRTVTATNIFTSREALIYKSEFNRKGNGEYRAPTVREGATLMSFPCTYQFIGTENAKWRMIGNAVCPSVSRALAASIRKALHLSEVPVPLVTHDVTVNSEFNLNNFKENKYEDPPKKNKGSRFRGHPFKEGNITVTLSNYNIKGTNKKVGKWITSVQYGNGKGFPHEIYPDGFYLRLESEIRKFENGHGFLEIINNGFSEKVAWGQRLQKMHDEQISLENYLKPSKLIEELSRIITSFDFCEPLFTPTNAFNKKKLVPKTQIMALYAINKISTLANSANAKVK